MKKNLLEKNSREASDLFETGITIIYVDITPSDVDTIIQ